MEFDFTIDVPLELTTPPILTAEEGQKVTLATDFLDPGRVGDYTATVRWGDGTIDSMLVSLDETGFAGSLTADHVYADDAVYEIRVTITDGDAGQASPTAAAMISGVAPVVTAAADANATVGESMSFAIGSFSDPGFTTAGSEEIFSATVDWGDGTTPDTATVSTVNGSADGLTVGEITGEHVFAAAGVYTVLVTVTDDDGLAGQASLQVTVSGNDPAGPAKVRFFVVDRADKASYQYAASGTPLDDFSLHKSGSPRGATTVISANPLWTINSNKRVNIYDTESQQWIGSWNSLGTKSPEGIATDGTDIWIVDHAKDRVYRYADAAARRSGKQSPSDSFSLAYGNRHPSGLTTDGQTLWVVDSHDNRVFAYDRAGTCINWWYLDPNNTAPRGITINPGGGDGIWVVDSSDDAVYHYAAATLDHLGGQDALDVFPLAAGNDHPEGIADPPPTSQFGDTTSDGISVAGELDEPTLEATAAVLAVDPPETTPIVFDTPYSGEISTPGAVDYFTFAGTAGEQIYFDVQNFSGGWIRTALRAPDGSTVFSSADSSVISADEGPLVLDQTGTYQLAFRGYGDHTPNYKFQINLVPPPDVEPIEIDRVYAGAIEVTGAADHWTFQASPASRFTSTRRPRQADH